MISALLAAVLFTAQTPPPSVDLSSLLRFRGNNVAMLGKDGSPQAFEVYVNEQVAGRLDFTLGQQSSGNAFNPITEWSFNGPWQTHAVLDYDDSPGVKDNIVFRWWMSSRELGQEDSYPLEIVMRRGSTIISPSRTVSPTLRTWLTR
jgi:hypothetical protein